MNDYERIAATIRFLNQHHVDQPDLAMLARGVGLSTFHFHRLFSAWAGVTPKDFLQCLTLEHVKTLLRAGDTVLNAAFEAGLSGPGRMHDLCVTIEAASPGELKTGGAGLRVSHGFTRSPFGEALIAETKRGICHLSFTDGEGRDHAIQSLRAEWPAAKFERADGRARELAETIFARDGSPSSQRRLRAFVRGTPFQLRVWRALLRVPSGSLTTYGRLSSVIAQSGAARAVGSAVGANPIAFIIPCHRVIRETGVLGNYRWDPIRKRAMIGWEMSRRLPVAEARAA
jgi:AraC family transcriptional regulator of adaptative response/methylated-DNA-[protein]-cysteine methyltransferase